MNCLCVYMRLCGVHIHATCTITDNLTIVPTNCGGHKANDLCIME